ncbi:(Fe-S)-binding protein [Mesoterricola sediminis]|uniref:(Fe-S)-binding protein n=2 Tax=Mesoterricola sediminis TaxID=2927980 RepID=A0AA48GQ00_9BACT|nr:(Fe-S)-binding protein [Mesoterricola sediminis]
MSHIALKDSYLALSERLNRFPQGAPPSELLFRILETLFSPEEAALVAQLPIRPFSAAAAARIWKRPVAEAEGVLEALASRGMLLDMESEGRRTFVLPPPMAGFFEFSMMRVGNGYDQKLLAELFHAYLNEEEDFVRNLFAGGETQLGRVFVDEGPLAREPGLEVLDYERASEVVKGAAHMGVGTCYCRHKMSHLGKACDAPMDICMTFGGTAQSLVKHGIARRVDAAEGLDLLQQARERGLVQFGENVRSKVAFICNCCGCCCEALLAAKRFAWLHPVATTNVIPEVDGAACDGCGKCVTACPVEAMGLVSAGDPHRRGRRKARLDPDLCLGCGVCARACARGRIRLRPRPVRVLTPATTAHRAVVMAIERGGLQHLIFDNRAQWNHRAMAAILGAILALPPVKRALASRQMKSIYLDRLLASHPPARRD